MIGLETPAALEERARSIEARVAGTTPDVLLPEARAAHDAVWAEVERDRSELADANARYNARFRSLTRYVPGTAARAFAQTELLPREGEVEADLAALGRLSQSLRALNRRVDAPGYGAVDDAMARLTNGNDGERTASFPAAAFTATRNPAQTAASHRAMVGDRMGSHTAALFAQAARQPADLERLRATFNALVQQRMSSDTAAILAVRGADQGTVTRFQTLARQMSSGVAALLATNQDPRANALYEALSRKTGGKYAAAIAVIAVEHGVPSERALRTFQQLSVGRGSQDASLLTMAALASGNTADQLDAAYTHFSERRTGHAAVQAAAWALRGRDDPAMLVLMNIVSRQINEDEEAAALAATMVAINAATVATMVSVNP